ncbi:hypothetical protein A0257_17075 [Hymenobacter psoromatis]|nr:hypothetical protein A0257_23300 [Hymenobacter psoromatis]AMR25624.1 hypothetical protein A0257_23325 [Hymenobacter psoromatis]AMR28640.1 hypothetical protein A0257_17075 [Hymenobacter psoromatis]
MVRFLVDINLPYRFAYWRGEEFLHQRDLNERWPNVSIRKYAADHNLTIITKDKDFAQLIRQQEPPPRVLWLRSGSCSLRQLHHFLAPHWEQALSLLFKHAS